MNDTLIMPATATAPQGQSPRSGRRWRKWVIGIVIVALLLVIAAIGAEVIARSVVKSEVEARLQQEGVASPEVKIKTGSLILSYLKNDIKRADVTAPLAQIDVQGSKVTLKDLHGTINNLHLGDKQEVGYVALQAMIPMSEVVKLAQNQVPQATLSQAGDKINVRKELGPVSVNADLSVIPVEKSGGWSLRINPETLRGSILGVGVGLGNWADVLTFDIDLPTDIQGLHIDQITRVAGGYEVALAGEDVKIDQIQTP